MNAVIITSLAIAGLGIVALILMISMQGASMTLTHYRTVHGPVTVTRIQDGEIWFETPHEFGAFAIDDIHPQYHDDLIVGHCFSELEVVMQKAGSRSRWQHRM